MSISIYAIILFGIRNEHTGNVDIPRYVSSFELLSSISFSQVSVYFSKDIGFYYVSKLFSMFFPSYNMWFLAIGTFLILNVSMLIQKFSNRIMLSYIIFFTFFFVLNFSLLRHAVAISLVISGFIAIKEEKSKKAILLLTLAPFFHISSIVAFLMFPLKKIKFGPWNVLMIIAATIISFDTIDFLSKIVTFLNMDRFESYSNNNVMTLTLSAFIINSIFFLILLFLVLSRPKEIKEKYSFELNIFSVGVAFYAFVGILAEFYRTAMFFSFILIVLLPNVLDEYKQTKYKEIIVVGEFIYGVALLIYFFIVVLNDGGLLPYEINY